MPSLKKLHGETSEPVKETQDGITSISEASGLGKTGM